jgi:endonuclease/exonuclease/phosphatase family metal-dependent hydrolase
MGAPYPARPDLNPRHERRPAGHETRVRIATFNILNGRSVTDDQVDLDRFAGAIRELDADVLALQEVDRNQPRSQQLDLTATAAEAMGAQEHRFVAALAGTPGATWLAATGDEQPDSAAYGVAFLSRYPVLAWQVVRLPPVPVRVPMRFHGRRRPEWVRDEPRAAVVADVDAPVGRLTVVATHLSFLRWWNPRQLRVLLGAARGWAGAERSRLVLMGDLNMGPARASSLTGMRPLATGSTFPVDEPTEQLDHILTDDPELRSDREQVVRLPVSDHRALVADISRPVG